MKLDKALINKKILVQLGLFELLRGFSFLLFAFFLTSIITQDSNQIILVCTTLIFRSISEYFIARLMRKFSHDVQLQTRRKIHEAIFRLDLIDPARILTLATETVSKIDLLITKILPVAFSEIVTMPMILIVTLIFDPISAGIFLITLPIAPILLFLIGKATREKSERAWFELNELNRDFHELLDGILTLKIFGQLKRAEKKLFETSEKSAEATLDVLKLAFGRVDNNFINCDNCCDCWTSITRRRREFFHSVFDFGNRAGIFFSVEIQRLDISYIHRIQNCKSRA